MKENPLIIALDVAGADEARAIVKKLGASVRFFKVGLELYAAAGPAFVRELVAEGNQVFLDLKMYDIHEQVRRATVQVAKLGPRFLTVHAQGQVMRAAMEASAGTELRILAVTVHTSMEQSDIDAEGHTHNVEDLVDLRARNAVAAGVDGIVCSSLEVARVRSIVGAGKFIVVPGVRSAGADTGDQKRVATPREAMSAGASYLVIGRQVTRAADPQTEVSHILAEIAG